MPERKGTLSFHLGFYSDEMKEVDLPVRVQRPDMTVVAESTTSVPLMLDPGTYFVVVQMPAGQELFTETKVTAGQHSTVNLRPSLSDASPYESQEVERFIGSRPFDFAFGLSTSETPAHRLRRREGQPGRKVLPGRLRLLSGNILAGQCKIASSAKFRVDPLKWTVRLDPSGVKPVSLIQLLQPGSETLNVAFPHGSFPGSFLYVHKHSNSHYTIEVHISNSTANSLLSYRERGKLQDAAIMCNSPKLMAKELLGKDKEDPLAAAVGAYTLLRFGEMERLDNWTENLRTRFDWLPDGLPIRGEHLARTGSHAAALDEFIRLPERGLPFFTDGITYSLDRLKLYLRAMKTPFDSSKMEAAERLFGRLETFSHFIDFSKPLLTFTGYDPRVPDGEEFTGDINAESGFDLSRLPFKIKN